MPTPAQTANALITFFCQEHSRTRNATLVVNRHTAKWGFQDIVADLGEQRTRELITYFFKTNRTKYDVATFLSIYDVLNKNFEDQAEDARKRAALRERTRKLVEEAEARNGEAGRGTD